MIDPLDQQGFLVLERLVKCTLGDASRFRYIIHTHTLDAILRKKIERRINNLFFYHILFCYVKSSRGNPCIQP